jgi:biopolymer transport protein ExbD
MIKRKKRHLPEQAMNITSLMDVLTVLLFFLIKSFSMTASQVEIPEDLRLPAAVSTDQFEEGLAVSLSKNSLVYHGQVLATLQNGRFKPADIGPDKRTILPLQQILDKENKKRMGIFKNAGNLSMLPPGKILIQSDKTLTFGTMKYLLHTASSANYGDFQFVVVDDTK